MRIRNQSRAIVINRRGEMLFVKHGDATPADPNEPGRLEYWVPPGGGVVDGETYEQAALRETLEETGLSVIGECRHIHTLEKPLMYGTELRLMHAQYYLVFHGSDDFAVRVADPDEGILDVRWWSLEDCRRSGERFLPDGIVEIVAKAVAA